MSKLKVKQFRYATDNFSYLIYGSSEAMGIDCGAVPDILDFVDTHTLKLSSVTNTHMHPDHTTGNQAIQQQSDALYIDNPTLHQKKHLIVGQNAVDIIATPGHTADSVSFYTGSELISGDTLFNGTVGNCFSGDLESFYHSVQKILNLPGETVIYAGHDYVEYAMAFARTLEPDNPHIAEFLQSYNPKHVFSTLSQELKVNPYLRFNSPQMIAKMQSEKLPVATEYERWHSSMQIG